MVRKSRLQQSKTTQENCSQEDRREIPRWEMCVIFKCFRQLTMKRSAVWLVESEAALISPNNPVGPSLSLSLPCHCLAPSSLYVLLCICPSDFWLLLICVALWGHFPELCTQRLRESSHTIIHTWNKLWVTSALVTFWNLLSDIQCIVPEVYPFIKFVNIGKFCLQRETPCTGFLFQPINSSTLTAPSFYCSDFIFSWCKKI